MLFVRAVLGRAHTRYRRLLHLVEGRVALAVFVVVVVVVAAEDQERRTFGTWM